MQYLSSFAPLSDVAQPAVMFFDDGDNLPEFAQDSLTDMFREARTVLGTNSQLNPIRGQRGDDYYLTFLKYLKPYTEQYSNTPTLPEIALNVGQVHHHVSHGSEDDYRMGPSTYSSVSKPENRLPVLIPKGVTGFKYPLFQIRTSMTRTYSYWGYLCDGATLTSKQQSVSVPVGELRNIQLSYSGLPENVFAVECLYQTNVNASNGYVNPVNNKGPVYYKSEDRLSETDEVINLSHAVMVMADNVFMRLLKGIDYEVESDLEPGTRPYLQFIQSSIEL